MDLEQLNLEDEGGLGGNDGREAAGTVSKLVGDGETGLLANAELGNTLVPALDDSSDADLGLEGATAGLAGRVELAAVSEGSGVYDEKKK